MSFFGDGDDDGDFDSPFFSHKTWVGIAIPVVIVAFICLAVAAFFYRRRRVRQRRNGVSLNQQGRLALERDLLREVEDGRSYRPREGAILDAYGIPLTNQSRHSRGPARRQPRTVNRWAWATTPGAIAHPEGLNELGEAPPPYEPPAKQPKPGGADEAERADGPDGVTLPEQAHLRRGSEPESRGHGRNRSIGGETIAATLTGATISTTATTAATTSATASSRSRSRPTSFTSAGETAASSMASAPTAVTSPPSSPPAYSEQGARRADRC